MITAMRCLSWSGVLVSELAICTTLAVGQVKQIEISEPATVNLGDLFKQADVVAVVYILSGDSEHYPDAIYKAEVLTPFKGVRKGERIYFGPFVSYAVGGEYLAFLRRSKDGARPADGAAKTGLHYGAIDVLYRIMSQGHSIMPVQYVCVFDGKDAQEQCDYGVKVNTHQVKLPKAVKTHPLEPDDESTSDRKWVKRNVLISVLEALRTSK